MVTNIQHPEFRLLYGGKDSEVRLFENREFKRKLSDSFYGSYIHLNLFMQSVEVFAQPKIVTKTIKDKKVKIET